MELAALTAFLAPFVPYLLKGGKALAEEAGDRLETKAGRHAQALWERIWPKVEEKEAGREAADDLAKAPDDADAQKVFEVQLRKALDADPELQADVERLWRETVSADVVVASGDRAVAVKGNVSGTISTGDDAQIGT